MAVQDRRPRVHVDSDGVKTVELPGIRPGTWLLASGLVLLSIAFLFWRPGKLSTPPALPHHAEPESVAEAVVPPRAQPPRYKPIQRPQPPEQPIESQKPPAVPAGERIEQAPDPRADEEEQAHQPSGIELFPPPGTDPPKSGLIVPEGFELPPGYVRHYQATDDGKRLPAILMFHPDYEWVDENGEALAIPEDRVVPPELAPAGLPLEMLEVPETDIPFVEEPRAGELPPAE